MNGTDCLSFPRELLERGRRMAELGQDREARRCLEHLVAQPEAGADYRVAAYKALAEIHVRNAEYKTARKCLAAALLLEPTCPDLHYRMAKAVLADAAAPAKRAWNHLNLAIALRPGSAANWCALGRAATKLRRPAEAARCFRKCLSLHPADEALLDELAAGLADLQKPDLVGAILFRGRFAQTPRNRSYLLSRYQMHAALRVGRAEDAEPAILDFPAVERRSRSVEAGGILRFDRGHAPAPRLLAFNASGVER